MLLIERPETDPYFNIAAEEYLLRNLEEDCFMLWESEPSVILGKHQNAFAEINRDYVIENDIPVIRRISGGGTVFHGPGNLNFTFIQRGEKDKLVDFRKFTRPVIEHLVSLGLPARFEGKNDIRINGLKVSGNAEHVYRDKVLHHGTLLFDARLDTLNDAIRGQEDRFLGNAVRSVRSTVANIASFLGHSTGLKAFRDGILDHMRQTLPGIRSVALSDQDRESIWHLVNTKYRTWEWNYGYSPPFRYEKDVRFKGASVRILLEVKNGIIRKAVTDPAGEPDPLMGLLVGTRFGETTWTGDGPGNAHAQRTDGDRLRQLLKELFK